MRMQQDAGQDPVAMARPFDFLVIGAQKAATTTLFQWLRDNPRVFVPPEKEAPFFTSDRHQFRGYRVFFDEFFGDAPDGALLGTVTPEYFGLAHARTRIAAAMPEAKLIFVCRDPIARMHSHYLMERRSGREDRPFAEVAAELLAPECLQAARATTSFRGGVRTYLSFSEYGHHMREWLSLFPRRQFLVLGIEEVEGQPVESYRRICDFLGVPAEPLPASLGRRFHEGGASTWLPTTASLKRYRLFRMLRSLLPRRLYHRFAFWYKLNNVRKGAATGTDVIDPATRRLLEEHFRPDAEAFSRLTGYTPPWPWFATPR